VEESREVVQRCRQRTFLTIMVTRKQMVFSETIFHVFREWVHRTSYITKHCSYIGTVITQIGIHFLFYTPTNNGVVRDR
jgi:hypothetical protein